MKFSVETANPYTASNNEINLPVDIEIADSPVFVVVALVGEKVVGGLGKRNKAMRSKRHNIRLDFSGFRSGEHEIVFEAFNPKQSSEPVYTGGPFKIQINDLEYAPEMALNPAIDLINVSPRVTRISSQIFSMRLEVSLSNSDGKRLTTITEDLSDLITLRTSINERNTTKRTRFDGQELRIWANGGLNPGVNTLQVECEFKNYPGVTRTAGAEIIFDQQAPILELEQEALFAQKLTGHEFGLFVQDMESGVNLDSLEVYINKSESVFVVEDTLDSEELTGKQLLRIRLSEKLWEGKHRIDVSVADHAGNRSDALSFELTIDTVAPRVVEVIPESEASINADQPRFSVLFNDKRLPAVVRLRVMDIAGVGDVYGTALHRAGIDFIEQLLNPDLARTGVAGIPRIQLIRFMTLAEMLLEVKIDGRRFLGILDWKVSHLMRYGVSYIQRYTSATAAQISDLLHQVRKLHTILDGPVHERIRVGDMTIVDGSQVGTFRLFLDGTEISDQSVLEGNSIICSYKGQLSEGPHQLLVEYADRAGNTGVFQSGFFADAIPPRIIDLTPNDEHTNDSPVQISARFTDDLSGIDERSIRVYLDDKNVTSECKISQAGFTLTRKRLTEGTHQVRVIVKDRAGNEAEAAAQFKYDTIPPSGEIFLTDDRTAGLLEEIAVAGKVDEDPAKISLRNLNSGKSRIVKAKKNRQFVGKIPLEPGMNSIVAEITDAAGNTLITRPTRIFRITRNTTAIFGRVLDARDSPIIGAEVLVEKMGFAQTTDHQGRFCICEPVPPEGALFLRISPPENTADIQHLRLRVTTRFGVASSLGDIHLIQSALAGAKSVPNRPGFKEIRSTSGDIKLTMDQQSLRFPPGSKSRKVAIQELDSSRLPVPLPTNMTPGPVIALEPPGLRFECENGAELSVPVTGLKPGTVLLMTSFDDSSGRWMLDGTGTVNHEGTGLSARIKHCSLYSPILPEPIIHTLDEGHDSPGADGLKGGLLLDIPLPSFQVLNQPIHPALHYSSMAAAPQVILTGVFRGLREVRQVESLPPGTLRDMARGTRVDAHIRARVYRDPNFMESLFFNRMHVQTNTENFTVFIPEGDANPYERLPDRRTEEDYWIEYDNHVTATPVILRNIEFTTSTDINTTLWPAAISARYYFGFMESDSKKIHGALQLKGPPGEEKEARVLPANLSVVMRIEPRLPSGDYYPTGLYSYLARFSVEAEGYRTVRTATTISDFHVDPGYRAHLAGERDKLRAISARTQAQESTLKNLDEMLDSLSRMEIANREGSIYSEDVSNARWQEPFDMLNQDQAGNVVVYNLSRSAFGRGWYPSGLQHLYPLGHNRALIAGPREKIVFSLNYSIHKVTEIAATRFALLPDATQAVVTDGRDIRTIDISSASVERGPVILETQNIRTVQRRYRRTRAWRQTGGYTDWYRVITECRKFLWWKYSCRTRREFERREYHYAWLWRSEGESAPSVETNRSFAPRISNVISDDESNIYIADVGTHRIYRLDPLGNLEVICGRSLPVSTRDHDYEYYDSGNRRLENTQIPSTGHVREETTITVRTGSEPDTTFTPDGSPARNASIHTPSGLAIDMDGNLVFSEQGYNRIRRINRSTGALETLAGTGSVDYDPVVLRAKDAALPAPAELATDVHGNIFAVINLEEHESQIIVKVDSNGNITRLAGSPEGTVTAGVDARIFKLIGVSQMAADERGHLYLVSSANRRAYRISQDGFIDEFAGSGESGALAGDDGPALQANLNDPSGLQITANGDVIILDSGHGTLRRVPGSILSTGPVKMRAPAGHFESDLERDHQGNWIRNFRDGARMFFDADGRQTRSLDRHGNETLFQYNPQGEIEKISYPGGAFLEFNYRADGKIASVIDHVGRETTLEIENQDLKQVKLADGRRQDFEYLPDGKLISKEESS